MAQFDLYVNPILAARRAYPYVVVMQSDFAAPSEQIVAPLAPSIPSLKVTGRLAPRVTVNGSDHHVFVPRLAAIRTRDLSTRVGSIAPARAELLAAIDYLFFGI